jgi:hypothetical protein
LPANEKDAKGPVTKRDIDVEWRTSSIRSDTKVFREGMSEWKKITEVDELVQLLNIANTEVTPEVLKAREELKNMKTPLLSAAAAASLKQKEPYQSADGLWHTFDRGTQQWRTVKEDPRLAQPGNANAKAKAKAKPKAKARAQSESKSEGKTEGKTEGKEEGKAEGKAEGKTEAAEENAGKGDGTGRCEPGRGKGGAGPDAGGGGEGNKGRGCRKPWRSKRRRSGRGTR